MSSSPSSLFKETHLTIIICVLRTESGTKRSNGDSKRRISGDTVRVVRLQKWNQQGMWPTPSLSIFDCSLNKPGLRKSCNPQNRSGFIFLGWVRAMRLRHVSTWRRNWFKRARPDNHAPLSLCPGGTQKNFSKIWLGCCLRSCKSSRETFVRLFFNSLNAKFVGQIGYHVFRSLDLFSWGSGLTFGFIMCYVLFWDQSWDLHVIPRDCTKSLKMDGRPFRPWDVRT